MFCTVFPFNNCCLPCRGEGIPKYLLSIEERKTYIPTLPLTSNIVKGSFRPQDHTETLIRLMKSIEMYEFSIIKFLPQTIVKEYVSSWENRKNC